MGAASYLIGVDTGGTYTDAVLIESTTRHVVATAKALTTRGDLAIGVGEAINKVLGSLPESCGPHDIVQVAVSTTLATNAVVEGHGSAVGVVLVGFDEAMVARTSSNLGPNGTCLVGIAGGHDYSGTPRSALDHDALRRFIAEQASNVEAFAVASQFAVRNPQHEHDARQLIVELTSKPVTVSSELSSALDAPRRALTAVLNARLISRISRLIQAVDIAMTQAGVSCPLMIVKGDGSLALASTVATRPLETVLSGPAASLVGAQWLSGRDNFILSDIGGTTTDIGVMINGRPAVVDTGAEVGGWRTMVKAVDVHTVGLGGDSRVHVDHRGALTVGPQRVIPLSLLAHRFARVVPEMAAQIAHGDISSLAARFVLRPLGWSRHTTDPVDLSDRERELLVHVGSEPVALDRLGLRGSAERALKALNERGLVQLAGFTPSDAAHVIGRQANWSVEAAEMGAHLLLRLKNMGAPNSAATRAFAESVWSETVRASAHAVIDVCLGQPGDTHVVGDRLIDAVCRGQTGVGLAAVSISPTVPIVAVGGPAKVFYGEVGSRLGSAVIFPEHFDVANAIGAATGSICREVIVEITADGRGMFHVHSPSGIRHLVSGQEALVAARAEAERAATDAAVQMGAPDPTVRVSEVTTVIPGLGNEYGLIAATITAVATGAPRARSAHSARYPAVS